MHGRPTGEPEAIVRLPEVNLDAAKRMVDVLDGAIRILSLSSKNVRLTGQ